MGVCECVREERNQKSGHHHYARLKEMCGMQKKPSMRALIIVILFFAIMAAGTE